MSTSGQSPQADNRNHTSRVAPRRHRETTSQPVASQPAVIQPAVIQPAAYSYDSTDFPVLLRMPDVSPPARRMETGPTTVKGNERFRDSDREESAPVASESNAHLNRFTWNEAAEKKVSTTARDRRTTGSASARFWSTIPPQVASGGMLLAVIAMCLVLMRGDQTPQPPVTPHSEWSDGGTQKTKDDVADIPVTPVPLAPSAKTSEWHPERSSVAAKPLIEIPEPTPARRPQAENPEAPAEAWPELPTTQDDVAPSTQGWPEEPQQPSDDQGGTMLNSPLGSAQRQSMTGVRMAGREVRQAAPPSSSMPRMSEAAYLNGTVQIPPATQIYRK